MHGDGWATHHGYKPLPKAPAGELGRWLDDILTSKEVAPVEAWVVDTSATSKKYKGATDHCVLVADIGL
jgi:hypothetical protein